MNTMEIMEETETKKTDESPICYEVEGNIIPQDPRISTSTKVQITFFLFLANFKKSTSMRSQRITSLTPMDSSVHQHFLLSELHREEGQVLIAVGVYSSEHQSLY